jgi:hypothetical protein
VFFYFFFQRLFPYGFVLLWRKEGKRKVALFLPLVRLPLFRLPLAKTKEEKKSSFPLWGNRKEKVPFGV